MRSWTWPWLATREVPSSPLFQPARSGLRVARRTAPPARSPCGRAPNPPAPRSRTHPQLPFRALPPPRKWVPHPGCHPERPERSDGSRRTCFLEIWRWVGYHKPQHPESCICAWLVGRGFIPDCHNFGKMSAALATGGWLSRLSPTFSAAPSAPATFHRIPAPPPTGRPGDKCAPSAYSPIDPDKRPSVSSSNLPSQS